MTNPSTAPIGYSAGSICELEFDLISVTGPDSRKFLQGQLTCNLEQLSESRSLRGAYCNLKGRVICDFRLFLRDDVHYLQTQPGMGEILQKTLDKYIVFSRAKTAICGNVHRLGLLGDDAAAMLSTFMGINAVQEGNCSSDSTLTIIRAEGEPPRFELFEFAESGALRQLREHAEQASARLWETADVEAGVAHISPALQELHTPQVLNYDLQGLIDFRKGCYTGQEIVARMHYRGTAKRRLYRLQADSVLTPVRIIIVHDGSESEGEIITSVHKQQDTQVLAILPCDAIGRAHV